MVISEHWRSCWILLSSCTPALDSDGFLRSEHSFSVFVSPQYMSGRKMFSLLLILFDFLQDLKGTLAQELDFENEAKNSERCAEELKHFSFVTVPKVFWEQTSKVRLLITARNNWTSVLSFAKEFSFFFSPIQREC